MSTTWLRSLLLALVHSYVKSMNINRVTWPPVLANSPAPALQASATTATRLAQVLRGGAGDMRERNPTFYMDQHQWEHWQAKCDINAENGKTRPDSYFYSALEAHPWRVSDPSTADLVVVPALLSLSTAGVCGDHAQNMHKLAQALAGSDRWRQRGGADHIISGHHWKVQSYMPNEMEPYIVNMTVIVCDHEQTREWKLFESNASEHRHVIIAPYGSIFDATNHSQRPRDLTVESWAQRPNSVNFIGSTSWTNHKKGWKLHGYNFHGYALRYRALMTLGKSFPDAVLVCTGMCQKKIRVCDDNMKPVGCRALKNFDVYASALVNARFGLFFRGDTSSSGHMYDLISAGTIPVVVDDGFLRDAATFPELVPWRRFALFIPEEQFMRDPAGSLRSTLAMSDVELQTRLATLHRVRKCLDWAANGSVVSTLILAEMANAKAIVPGHGQLMRHGTFCNLDES